ncbi:MULTISPECIES: hypothetical protein [unclassified Mesorhizobium]|uniref:hypothetical protein n=1 Tax=unclassified Mesorhizobium TaxID=325217 RepID=UPI000FD3AA84|nr:MULTISPECIES: hypothetical protein [unclassified Mesorhizobium]RUX02823.1 hypothetical protein EOA30_17315 [Mesorhizobium sp. M8A.F.Ca.ET.059.01.1.1]RVD51223.1 hypothetical protein EN746_15940 [Mesorhizobium sp. M8A.F.Ca.ET.023.02.2.1]TGP66600.1 hypothetical protein EN870_34150 [bacterium M00.F.Ca.ET.227.01.1.1]TGW07975.1 hypothetical protein EN788_33760 [Mesorhizobium sp. M2D.F.Ca.ET.145.01.1.1]RWC77619.1 MAG: hypothetical protein EOS30_08595 [Mesorhizobium sp.]
MTSTISNREDARSDILQLRVADLRSRMRNARITEGEIKTFQKVAAVMEDGQGRIDGDDLIAASFVTDALTDTTRPE